MLEEESSVQNLNVVEFVGFGHALEGTHLSFSLRARLR
jgi:hypothetical protein